MKKLLYIGLILFVGFGSLLQLSAYVHNDLDFKNHPYIKLVPPPPIVLGAEYGNPLVTTDIGLFAYYEGADWDLNDVIPAFQNYTQHSNYVDGYVRVHHNVRGTTFDVSPYGHTTTDPSYIDVQVRVRSDGWIMAWLEDSQNKAFICHWGDDCRNNSPLIDAILTPVEYSTCLARAIYRVYHNAGVSWIGYDAIFYYDYEFPDATRLCIFGDFTQTVFPTSAAREEHFYFTVPSGVTIEAGWLGCAGKIASGDSVDLDEVDIWTAGWASGNGWREFDITSSLSSGTRHDVKLKFNGGGQGEHLVGHVMLWTS